MYFKIESVFERASFKLSLNCFGLVSFAFPKEASKIVRATRNKDLIILNKLVRGGKLVKV